MSRSSSRWTPPGRGLKSGGGLERQVADVCACLDGDVYLSSRSESNDDQLPVPWIAVFFRAETIENANDPSPNANPNAKTQSTNSRNTSNNNNNNSVKTNYGPYNATLRRAHEKLVAIRFLSLVARCPEYSWRGNPRFWWHVLANIGGTHHCEEFFKLPREHRTSSFGRRGVQESNCAAARDVGEVQVMPKFQLVFSSVKVKSELLFLVAQALSSTPNGTFQQADQQVQNMLARMRIVIPQQPRVVKIDLSFVRSRLRVMDSVSGLQTLLEEASGKYQPTTKVLFRVRCLDLSDTTVSERDLAPLAQIMSLRSLSVRDLELNWVFTAKTSKRFMRPFCDLVAACFAISLIGNANEIYRSPLTKLSFNSSTLSGFQLASIFSAIHEGGGVRELSLHCFEGNDSWLWMAFAIFHPQAMSQIVDLDLSHCVIRLEDIKLTRNLVRSADYTPYLMQRKIDETLSNRFRETTVQWVLLPAGTRLEIPRDTKKDSRVRHAPALKLQDELWCVVLDSGVSWTCVLVPAYGKLYVKNSKIIKQDTRVGRNHKCKLKTLTMVGVRTASQVLRVGNDGELWESLGAHPVDQVLSEWVKTIGQSLQTLNLRSNPLANRTLAVILESCPTLTSLDVSECELTAIGHITRAFQRGSCILCTFKAAQNHISAASQEEFFRLLGDTECDSVRNLLVLHLEDNPTSPENRILNVLRSSLRRNNTLRYVTLTMDERHDTSRYLRSRFDKDHHDKWLGYEGLPIKHRFAFLSISIVKTLPVAVIEIIFDLARRDVFRHVLWE